MKKKKPEDLPDWLPGMSRRRGGRLVEPCTNMLNEHQVQRLFTTCQYTGILSGATGLTLNSSLLNAHPATGVLPVGLPPVSTVPTRITCGEKPAIPVF